MTRSLLALAFAIVFGSSPLHGQDMEEDPRLVERVGQLASSDPEVRAQAGRELLGAGRNGIVALLDAAAGSNVIVAEEARRVLTSAGPDAIGMLRDAGFYKRFDHRERHEEAVAAVARMGVSVMPQMLEAITTTDPDAEEGAFAGGVLRELGPPAVEPMIRLLKHPKPKVRHKAAGLLAYWGDPRAFDGLLAALKDEDGTVRAYAARGLGKLGDRRAAEALLRLLRDGDWGARRAAVGAIGRMYEPRFLRPIARAARSDEQILVRETAAAVLIHSSRDPVAIRIGKRYKPYDLSPVHRRWIEFGFHLRMGLTGLVLLGSGLWLWRGMAGRGGTHWARVGLVFLVAGGTGFLWGRVVDNVWGTIENQLLFLLVPLLVGVGFLAGKLFGGIDPVRMRAVRSATVTTAACFYVGYGIGWLALWGYFGL